LEAISYSAVVTKRNNGNIFGLFVVWKEEIRDNKENETWIYKGPTKYDI
jgi:hypothetical protein